jgi:hypothetical protein
VLDPLVFLSSHAAEDGHIERMRRVDSLRLREGLVCAELLLG